MTPERHDHAPAGKTQPARVFSVGRVTAAALLLTALTAVPAAGQAPAPEHAWRQVTVYRDAWGTPYVYGESPFAMAYGLGYAHAGDALESVLLAYRLASGRAAEVLGEPYAESDRFARQVGHARLAREAWPEADPLTRALCEGYAAGVNTRLGERAPESLPEWAEGIAPSDVLALLHAYLLSYAPVDLPDAWQPAPAAATGNAWAVGPSRSASGAALLVVNPHAPYDGLFRWTEAHLSAPGYTAAGGTLLGLPVILQGHNARLGWALTPNFPDTADAYIETPPRWRGAPGSIRPPGIDFQMSAILMSEVETETVLVRTGEGMRREGVERLLTPRGPVIGRQDGRFVTWHAAGHGEFGALRQLFLMGQATTSEAFRAALELRQLPSFHIVYADRDGALLYLYNATVGNKRGPRQEDAGPPVTVDWSRPVPGTAEYAWGDPVPLSSLPAVANPASGFVQACGTTPWNATTGSNLDPANWPAWFIRDADTFRAERVRALLERGQRSFDDMQFMLYDVYVPFAERAVPKLIGYAGEHPDAAGDRHPDLAAGLDVLKRWNYVADAQSPGMTFFHLWWASVEGRTPGFPNPNARYRAFLDGGIPMETALDAASQAARLIRNEFDAVAVPWGDAHVIRRGERRLPIAGAATGQPIFLADDHAYEEGAWEARYGYAYARVVEFTDPPRAVSMLPFGVSDDPESPHYDDQLDLMVERRLKYVPFAREDVEQTAAEAAGTRMTLPGKGLLGQVAFSTERPARARVRTSASSPGPLPAEAAPYTVFVTPELTALAGDAEPPAARVRLDARVPPEVCSDARFRELALYGWSDGAWRRVQTQSSDPATRTLTAEGPAGLTYAALGPPLEPREDTAAPPAPEATVAEGPDQGFSLDEAAIPSPDEMRSGQIVVITEKPLAPVKRDPRAASGHEPKPRAEMAATSGGEGPPAAPAQTPLPESSLPTPGSPVKGPPAWGRDIAVTIPGGLGEIHLAASELMGARAVAALEAPEPLPPGYASASPFITLDCSAPEAIEQVALTLAAREQPTPPTLFRYATGQGWAAVEDQAFDAARQTLTARDAGAHTYVLVREVAAAPQAAPEAPAEPAAE